MLQYFDFVPMVMYVSSMKTRVQRRSALIGREESRDHAY